MGIDSNFTRIDMAQSIALFGWSMFWFLIFAIFTLWNIVDPWPTQWWATYWRYAGIYLPLALGAATTIWLTIGGIRDLKRLFVALKSQGTQPQDDGQSHRHH